MVLKLLLIFMVLVSVFSPILSSGALKIDLKRHFKSTKSSDMVNKVMVKLLVYVGTGKEAHMMRFLRHCGLLQEKVDSSHPFGGLRKVAGNHLIRS